MLYFLSNLNWVSVLIAFVAYFVLGGLWFTVLFGKPYRASLGRTGEVLPNRPIFIVGPAICSLLITVTNALLIYALNINTISDAVEFASVTGIGYLVANTVNIAINPNIPRPIFYGLISGAYHLVAIVTASVILVTMK